MANMIIGGEMHHMPVWLKARLLVNTIETTDDASVLTVESGTDHTKRHAVDHDGSISLACSCKATIKCAHMQAVELYLQEQVGECEAKAMEIIAAEQASKEQAQEARKAAAIAHAEEYRRQLEQSPWNWATTNNRAVHPAVKEAERHLAEVRHSKIESFSFMK